MRSDALWKLLMESCKVQGVPKQLRCVCLSNCLLLKRVKFNILIFVQQDIFIKGLRNSKRTISQVFNTRPVSDTTHVKLVVYLLQNNWQRVCVVPGDDCPGGCSLRTLINTETLRFCLSSVYEA